MTKKKETKKKEKAPEAPQRSKEEDLLVQLQRLQAEFDNFKKREEREKEAFVKMASNRVLSQLLPILDNFELALKNVEQKGGFYEGVEMIYSQFVDFLKSNGVEEIHCEGKFDPAKHEAMLSEEAKGKEKNEILEVLQKGYVLNDRILRTAKVKVAK